MSAIEKFNAINSMINEVRAFLGLIGKPSVSAKVVHVGSLHSLTVSTIIFYEPHDAARNFHRNRDFDAALAEVVCENFKELSEKALTRMIANRAEEATRAFDELAALEKQLKEACQAIDQESLAPAKEQPATADDGWIKWNGGECPVTSGTIATVKFRAGAISVGFEAGGFNWLHRGSAADIIAYKVVT